MTTRTWHLGFKRALLCAAAAGLSACSAADEAVSADEATEDVAMASSDATCGQLGGAHCDLGDGGCRGQGVESSDCPLCCGGDVSPSCGQLGGVLCGESSAACQGIAGAVLQTWDCNACCGAPAPLPRCATMGGHCAAAGSCSGFPAKASDCGAGTCCVTAWSWP